MAQTVWPSPKTVSCHLAVFRPIVCASTVCMWCSDWLSLKPDILVLLKAHAACIQHFRSTDFFMNLLILAQPQSCPTLLSSEGNELLDNLKDFLVDYLQNVRAALQGQLRSVLVIAAFELSLVMERSLCVYVCV